MKLTVEVIGGKAEVKTTNSSTVLELKAEMSLANYQATVNGESVDDSHSLNEYDYVIFTPAVKGA